MEVDKWEKEYAEFWRELITTDGKLDEQKIKNELRDLVFIYEQVSKVYMHLTNGKLSKPMYFADVIISEHDDLVQKSYEEGAAEARGDLRCSSPHSARKRGDEYET